MKKLALHIMGLMVLLCTPKIVGAETIVVSSTGPTTLEYDKGDKTGNFLTSQGDTNSSMSYTLSVDRQGDYLLYLHTGNKLNGGQIHQYDVELNNQPVATYKLDFTLGGNWNNFVVIPQKINLPAGEVNLKITQVTERCYVHSQNAPVLIPEGYLSVLGNNEVEIDLLYADPTSTLNFTSAAAFKSDNSGYGDTNSVLVTNDDHSTSNGTKDQACYPKTKLLYLVNVTEEADYKIDAEGTFYSKPDNDVVSTAITDFPLIIKSVWNQDNYFTDTVITNFTASNNNKSTASGEIHLKKGVYFIEISTDQNGPELLFLSDLKFSTPYNIVPNSNPVGMHVPVLSINTPEGVFLGHNFDITGSFTLDQEDDQFVSAEVFVGVDKLGDATKEENNSYSFTVSDFSNMTEEQVYDISVKVTVKDKNENAYTVTETIQIDLQKKQYNLSAEDTEGGNITFTDNKTKAKEGENIEVTITPNEGYDIKSVSINGQNVNVTPDQNTGIATYTISDIRNNQIVSAVFEKKIFEVTLSQPENGVISVNVQDNKVAYGESLLISVTPNSEAYYVKSVKVDGQPITFNTNENGQATYTVEPVKGNLTVSAELSIKTFTVTVNEVENGELSVTPSLTTVEYGTDLEITATPNEGYEIKSVKINGEDIEYSENEYGIATCTFESVKANVSISAEFQKITFDVKVVENVNGSITTDANEDKVEYGDDVEITVSPNTGYNVESIIVNESEVEKFTVNENGVASYIVKGVKSNLEVKAVFSLKVFTVIFDDKLENAEILVDAEDGKATYGQKITITVTPETGYFVKGVTVNGEGVNFETSQNDVATYSLSVESDIEITAQIGKKEFKIEIVNSEKGTIESDAPNGDFEFGSDVKITVIPEEGYKVESVIVNNTPVDFDVDEDGVATVILSDLKENITVSAEYILKSYVIDTKVIGNGTVVVRKVENTISTLSEVEKFDHGTTVEIVVTPDEGHVIKSIIINGETLEELTETGHVYTIDSITSDHLVEVEFMEGQTTGIRGIAGNGISYEIKNGGLKVETGCDAKVYLYTLNGMTVYQGISSGEIFISTTAKGLHILRIETASGAESVKIML